MDFRIGRPVMAEDGRAGTLDRLIFDPVSDQVRGLVVSQGGLLTRDVVVPLDRVLSANEEEVRVRGKVAEIAALEGFTQAQFTAPPEEWLPPEDLSLGSPYFLFPASPYAVGAFASPAPISEPAEEAEENKPPGSVDLGAATEVVCTDGTAGTVDRVLTEGDSDRLTHLIVHRGSLLTREIAVPAEFIATTDEQSVYLTISQQELDELPEFDEEGGGGA
jgi:uncharacterized protein YrrD